VPLLPAPAPVLAQSPAINWQGLLLQLALTNPALAQFFLQQPQLPQQQLLLLQPFLQLQLQIQPRVAVAAMPNIVSLPAAAGILVLSCSAPNTAPPSPAKPIRLSQAVSCHDFCDRYEVSPGDEVKLDKLEFVPGDRGIEKLD